MKTRYFAAILALITWQSLARATERYRQFDSVRQTGRGGTASPSFLSDEALRTNPATLGEANPADIQFRWAQLDLFVNENALDTISDVVAMVQDSPDAASILDTFSDKFGKRQFARLQLFPLGIRWGHFDIEPFIVNQNFMEIRIPTIPEFSVLSDTSMGISLGFGMMIGKSIEVGLAARVFNRIHLGGQISTTDVMQIATDKSKEFSDFIPLRNGQMIGVDIGANWTPSAGFRTSLLIKDVGDTSATGDGPKEPPRIAQTVHLGALYRAMIGKFRWDSAVEIQDALNRAAVNYLRLIHAGTEFGIDYFTPDNDLGVQFGINEGYLTFGGFLDLWFLRLDVTNYAVEAGEYPGQRPDRRWGFSLKTNVTF